MGIYNKRKETVKSKLRSLKPVLPTEKYGLFKALINQAAASYSKTEKIELWEKLQNLGK